MGLVCCPSMGLKTWAMLSPIWKPRTSPAYCTPQKMNWLEKPMTTPVSASIPTRSMNPKVENAASGKGAGRSPTIMYASNTAMKMRRRTGMVVCPKNGAAVIMAPTRTKTRKMVR